MQVFAKVTDRTLGNTDPKEGNHYATKYSPKIAKIFGCTMNPVNISRLYLSKESFACRNSQLFDVTRNSPHATKDSRILWKEHLTKQVL